MSELEIQENMSAEEAFMDTESAYEEIPEAFQKLAQLLGQDQFELLFPDKDVENQDEMLMCSKEAKSGQRQPTPPLFRIRMEQ